MRDDLHTQIEQYTAAVIDRQRPITTEEALASIAAISELPEVELRTESPWWRRIGLAAAATGLMLVFIGLVPFLLARNDARPAETPSTVTRSALSSAGWSRVPHDESVFGGEGEQSVSSVTVGGPGLVGVGIDGPWGDGDAAVWTSVDGVTWTRVPHDESVFGGEGMNMRSVTIGGPGLVAVGWEGETLAVNGVGETLSVVPDSDAAVWTSVDGIVWSRVPHDEEVFGSAFMESVTAGGPGLVAVGMDGPWGDGDAAVWTSVDGVTWTRVPHDESVFGGVDSQVIHDVTVGGPGLVAVGNDGGRTWWDNNTENNPAVWTSVDGVNWSRVPDDETVFGTGDNAVMLSVTAGGPGLVAVGGDLAETAVWTSSDGVTWTRVPDDETVRGLLSSVTAGGPGLVAVGLDASGVAVWTSVDGITWSLVSNDDAVFGSGPPIWTWDVTVGGPGLVAVGSLGDDATVWVWEPEGE